MGFILMAAIFAVVALKARAQQSAPPAAPAPAPAQEEQQPPPSGPATTGGALDLGQGALVAAAVGGAFAKGFQENFGNQHAHFTNTIAPGVGAVVAGGTYLALGGFGGAGAIVGAGAISLPAIALIIVPAIVLTVIVLQYVQIFEEKAKSARFVELGTKIRALMKAGNYAGAWNIAVDAAQNEKIPGLGFRTNSKAAIPASLPLTDGTTLHVAETLKNAYAHSKETGDSYANAINDACPWLNPGTVRSHYDPGYAAAKAALYAAMVNDGTIERLRIELQEDAIDRKTGADTTGTGSRYGY